jgi:hypothetical protein
MTDISEESISALMARWGRAGGLARSERKQTASRRNLENYRQRAAVSAMPTQAASAAPLPVLFFPVRNENANAPQI